MKKVICILLSLVFVFAFAACGGSDTPSGTTDPAQPTADSSENTQPVIINEEGVFPSLTDAMEYTLYQNIFYNNEGDAYVGQKQTKTGTFATVYDEWNKVTRYYVWGYYDMTKCCDWQWEIKVEDMSSLPENGSLVEVSGVFEKSEDALDGYWLINPGITVKTPYRGIECDIDMSVMSATLERVQILNLQNFPDAFDGKKVAAYGRVVSDNMIQHPYYDGAWQQHVLTDGTMPDIDMEVLVIGVYKDAAISSAQVSVASYY